MQCLNNLFSLLTSPSYVILNKLYIKEFVFKSVTSCKKKHQHLKITHRKISRILHHQLLPSHHIASICFHRTFDILNIFAQILVFLLRVVLGVFLAAVLIQLGVLRVLFGLLVDRSPNFCFSLKLYLACLYRLFLPSDGALAW